jgi:hypothetical protein
MSMAQARLKINIFDSPELICNQPYWSLLDKQPDRWTLAFAAELTKFRQGPKNARSLGKLSHG